MKTYTDVEKQKIGKVLAEILNIKTAKGKYGYITAWGTKTERGIFEVFTRLSEEVNNGTIWSV